MRNARHLLPRLATPAALLLTLGVFLLLPLPGLFRASAPDPEVAPRRIETFVPPPEPTPAPSADPVRPGPLPADLPATAPPPPELDFGLPPEGRLVADFRTEFHRAFAAGPAALLGDGQVVEVFALEELDRVPALRTGIAPDYPRELRREGIGGEVRLRVSLDPAGQVDVREVLSSPHPALTRAALDAARHYSYEPPTRDGKPVRAEFIMPFPFETR